MDDPWDLLESAAVEARGPLWSEFAKKGRESAVFGPLARYPAAAGWLAERMSLSTDYITRKLGAMLAGWVHDPTHAGLLSQMLDRERKVFADDSLNANSVGEDIMFAATRWAESQDSQVKSGGTNVLARMIWDALENTHWNTVHWAIANLHRATDGEHAIFKVLANATDKQVEGQRFLQDAVRALRENDMETLRRLVAAPSGLYSLSPRDPCFSTIRSLWNAAASAEALPR